MYIDMLPVRNEYTPETLLYIAKLGYADVDFFFLFLHGEAVLTCTCNLCFDQKLVKQKFYRYFFQQFKKNLYITWAAGFHN